MKISKALISDLVGRKYDLWRSSLNFTRFCYLYRLFLWALLLAAGASALAAQENPYIVAYDHNLEEPGNLEVEYFFVFGAHWGAQNFHALWSELGDGSTSWSSTELYLLG